MNLLIFVQLLLILLQVSSRNLLSRLGTQSGAFYRCVRESGFNQLMTILLTGSRGVSQQDAEGLNNAKNAGLIVAVELTLCRERTPEDELKFLISRVGEGVIDKIYIVPDDVDLYCQWSTYQGPSNCQYLQKLIELAKKNHNIQMGVSSDIDGWKENFKSITACPEVSSAPLYWLTSDGGPDFSTYQPFGGWKLPYMKMYDITRVCNHGFQLNYYV